VRIDTRAERLRQNHSPETYRGAGPADRGRGLGEWEGNRRACDRPGDRVPGADSARLAAGPRERHDTDPRSSSSQTTLPATPRGTPQKARSLGIRALLSIAAVGGNAPTRR